MCRERKWKQVSSAALRGGGEKWKDLQWSIKGRLVLMRSTRYAKLQSLLKIEWNCFSFQQKFSIQKNFSGVSFEGLKQVWCLQSTNILTCRLPTINTRRFPPPQNRDDQENWIRSPVLKIKRWNGKGFSSTNSLSATLGFLRIQLKLNTALLSTVRPSVRHRRDISHFSHICIKAQIPC